MTVSRAFTSLYLFRSKVEEAVNLVPSMCAEEKLKAVQFWNAVSEKLQDIVNNSAADINAIALKMDEEETVKMTLELNSQDNLMVQHNSVPIVDFTSHYSTCNGDPVAQFHTNLTNHQMKPFISNSLSYSNISKEPVCVDAENTSQIYHLNAPDHYISNTHSNQYLSNDNISNSDCDTFSKNPQSSSHSSNYEKSYSNKDISHSSSKMLENSSDFLLKGRKRNSVSDENFESSSTSVIMNHKSPKKNEMLNKVPIPQINYDLNLKPVSDSSEDGIHEGDSFADFEASNESNFEVSESFDQSNSEKQLQGDVENQSSEANITNTGEDKIYMMCQLCSKSFPDDDSLARHHLRVHERHYCCSECKAKFTTKGNLIVHMRRHTGEKPFCCHKCPANFTTKGNLQRHIKTHSGEKPWQCTKCGSCFTEKKSLTIHMRRHTGERPYQCKECGKRFSQTSILQTHMAMHMDLKIHLCEKCGKSFRQKSQLRIHSLRHDNIRPYMCQSCSASFLTKGDLIRHEKTHTREKPFVCEVCSKGFTRQQSLNEHKNRHYGIKPYKCKHCGKAFPEMSGCYKHMKCHEKAKEGENIKANESETERPLQALTGDSPKNEDVGNELPNVSETPSYIAVVLNAKDPAELGNEINQAVSFFNSGVEENNVSNGIGVLTAINFLTNASSLPQNFQSVS